MVCQSCVWSKYVCQSFVCALFWNVMFGRSCKPRLECGHCRVTVGKACALCSTSLKGMSDRGFLRKTPVTRNTKHGEVWLCKSDALAGTLISHLVSDQPAQVGGLKQGYVFSRPFRSMWQRPCTFARRRRNHLSVRQRWHHFSQLNGFVASLTCSDANNFIYW